MGLLVEGVWHDNWYDTKASKGRFIRTDAQFRDWVKADGSTPFRPESGRYHLYVSYACPWAHRTLIFRKLKGLEEHITISVVDPYMPDDTGWVFSEGPKCIPDTVNGCDYVHQLYQLAQPDYSGRVTLPVLWDKKTNTIVNNESSEIIRMFNHEFGALADPTYDFYPVALREEIEAINEKVYHNVNDGVYRTGFATTQEAYEEGFDNLFATLDEVEAILGRQPYLAGDRLTEADWRLFTTLYRFDAVYHNHFKCNRQRIIDYPNLSNYTRALYQFPGIAETCHMDHAKQHYYSSHHTINPTRIVPKGPTQDLNAPHDRPPFIVQPHQHSHNTQPNATH